MYTHCFLRRAFRLFSHTKIIAPPLPSARSTDAPDQFVFNIDCSCALDCFIATRSDNHSTLPLSIHYYRRSVDVRTLLRAALLCADTSALTRAVLCARSTMSVPEFVVMNPTAPQKVPIDPETTDPFYRYKTRQLLVQQIGNGKMMRTALVSGRR